MFNIIGKINQVVLLLAGLLVIFMLGKEVIDKLTPIRPYERPKVAIEQPENNENVIEIKTETNFLLKVKDVYVFSLESNTIDPSRKRYADQHAEEFRMPRRSYSRDQMTNILFSREDGTKHLLLDGDALIGEFMPAEFKVDKTGEIFGANVYHIATEDSNNDGFLSEKDSFSIYISNYDGSGLRKLKENVASSYVIKENTLIIRTGTKYNSQFYIYDLQKDSLVELDVSTKLEDASAQITD